MRNKDLKKLEGKSVKDARVYLSKLDIEDIRIISPEQGYTAEYRPNRVNLEIEDGIVQRASKG